MATGAAAQNFLTIDTIREDIIVMKDGGFRAVIMCSSLNFALKSADEQDAITFQYQNFLNSLDFPIQFVIHSRRLNIAPYLETLEERRKEQDNELLKIQVSEYVEFIKTFVSMTKIMSKTFYLVIPFIPPLIERENIFRSLVSSVGFGKKGAAATAQGTFEEYKTQLWQRVETVVAGVQRFGIRAVPLNTEEVVELFYGLYNPTEFEQLTPMNTNSVNIKHEQREQERTARTM